MLMNTFLAVLFASTLACLVTTIGIYIIARYEKWGNQNAVYFMSFATGVLISVSIIHIIPKSIAWPGRYSKPVQRSPDISNSMVRGRIYWQMLFQAM